MDVKNLKELLEDQGSIAVLASADDASQPNAAVFGSPRVMEDGRVMLGLADNRTWQNLQENSRALLLVFQPGEQFFNWRGLRAQLEFDEAHEDGPLFDRLVAGVEEEAGRMAAQAIRRAVLFRVSGMRPLIDRLR
jgi:hypothetical protein